MWIRSEKGFLIDTDKVSAFRYSPERHGVTALIGRFEITLADLNEYDGSFLLTVLRDIVAGSLTDETGIYDLYEDIRNIRRASNVPVIPLDDCTFEFNRTRNALKKRGISNLNEAARFSDGELLNLRTFGEAMLQDLKRVIKGSI